MCLDAGCGTGLPTEGLSSRCGLVVALDYSLASLRALQAKELSNVLLVQGDLGALPFKDGVFDAALCANALQHLKPDGAQQRAVMEISRALRPGGTMSVSVHHFSRGKRAAGWIKEGKPGQPGIGYIFRFTRRDLRELIPGASTRAVGYYGLIRLPWVGARVQDLVARLLGRIAARLGHGHMLVAVARKRHVR
jgi:SAM-dependent methyltransferase